VPSQSKLNSKGDTHEARIRWWRVGQTAGANFVARFISGLCQLVMVPLLLHAFGAQHFGWVMTITNLVALSQFIDLGVAIALQHTLAEAWSRRATTEVQTVFASGVWILMRIGILWFLAGAPLAWWFGKNILPNADIPHGNAAWVVTIGAISVGVVSAAGARLAAAVQQGWIFAGWTAVGNIGAVAALSVLGLVGRLEPITAVVILAAAQTLPGTFTAVHAAKRLNWPSVFSQSDPATAKLLWGQGLHFAAPNIAGAALQAFTPIGFARFGGYAAAAAFAVLQRLFGLISQAHAMLLAPLWPAYTEAAHRGEASWIKRSFQLAMAATVAASAAIAAIAAGLPWILQHGVNNAVVPPAVFSWLIAAWFVGTMFAQACSFLLLGLGRLSQIALPVAAIHAVTIAGMLVIGSQAGSNGVAMVLAAASIMGLLPLFARATARALSGLAESASASKVS
jgi:O-antigen/teichoic acid export membrane protein